MTRITVALVSLLILVLGFIGWIINLVSIFTDAATASLVEMVIRIAGVFAFPIGALAGWFL